MERIVYTEAALPPAGEGTMCTAEEGKTRQSDKRESDINYIVKKYEQTGTLPPAARAGVFMDVSAVPSFQEVLGVMDRASTYFLSLPPSVRELFDNEPAKMLDAWNAGEMREVFEKIGLLEPVPEPAVAEPVVEPAA